MSGDRVGIGYRPVGLYERAPLDLVGLSLPILPLGVIREATPTLRTIRDRFGKMDRRSASRTPVCR